MQRHLALLGKLFPLPLWSIGQRAETRTVDRLLDRAKQELELMQARHRERTYIALTQRDNLENQVADLHTTIATLQRKIDGAVRSGERDVADALLREQQRYEESLQTAEETLVTAKETVEQIKILIKWEEEGIRQKTAEILARKAKWKQAEIQQAMEEELRRIGAWHLVAPREPELDLKTLRELVGFLLLLSAGLLLLVLLAQRR